MIELSDVTFAILFNRETSKADSLRLSTGTKSLARHIVPYLGKGSLKLYCEFAATCDGWLR